MTALVTVDQIERMAVSVARSGLFGVKNPDQAMALMLIAQAEGLHPAIAARDYHIINGRPALRADAMLARFQNAGGKVEWGEYTDTKVSGKFSHPSGGSVDIVWTTKMAQDAGLTKNPTWRSYPRQMLRARCISEGIRTVFPGVVVGTYTPEEVQDMEPVRQPPQRQTAEPQMVEEVVEPVDVDALIQKCTLTSTLEGMELWRDEIRRVPKGPDRERLMAAVKRRVEEIKAQMQAEPQASEEPQDEGVI
ncbi:MAG: hypothetical protein ACO3WK_12955 [Steroidobacteraceae bacterium]|jgi:hypothetical protein